MARIPQEEIERLKIEVNLKELVEFSGVKLEPKGKDFIGLCPFHNDKDPSLIISPDKNLWNCLGACSEGGDIIRWVEKFKKISFRHAFEILREVGSNINISGTKKLESQFHPDFDKQQLLNIYNEFCHTTLKENSDGIEYLKKRKLYSPEIVDKFKLGISNKTLGYRLPKGKTVPGGKVRGKLQAVGVLKKTGFEHFYGSLTIPIFDNKNNVVEMYGRKYGVKNKPGTALHLYLPGPHKGIFNLAALKNNKKEIILCESLIDALTFWNFGFKNVTSSYGINGLTEEMLKAFKQYKIKKILIAYDRDNAGNLAAKKLAAKLIKEGFECFRINFPMNMDANSFVQDFKDEKGALENVIKNAEWIGGVAQPPIKPAVPVKATESVTLENDIPTEIKDEEIIISLSDRRWRIRGLKKNLSYDLLKVNILVSKDGVFYVDTLDLYSARHRATFIKLTAVELGLNEEIVKRDIGKVLLKLEELQDKQIKETLEPKEKEIILTEEERGNAIAFLKDPDLLNRILDDFERCGVVGEKVNKLVGYLAAVSRKLDQPLAIIIQSSSSAGKTWLMDSVLAFVPNEEKVKYSAMTGQSLFYLGETSIKNKILAIVEEEGAERASYALKLLQSEGELSIASTGKDPATGRLITHEYRVEGPVMIFSTTTSIEIDEELQNRCIILTVNESREQTRAIHKRQRELRTLAGLKLKKEKEEILKLHRNAQRLLAPLSIVNPFATKLTFLDDRTRTRRDHIKYLNLIETIALLYQYQRPVKTMIVDNKEVKYIDVTFKDIELANRLANEVLGRSLNELPPQTTNLLLIIESMVKEESERLKIKKSDYRFSRRQIREYCGWGNTQIKLHFNRLEEMEYLIIHSGGRGQSFEYELLYDGSGKGGNTFLMGLIDTEKLQKGQFDAKRSGVNESKSVPSRCQVAPKSGGCRTRRNTENEPDERLLLSIAGILLNNAYKGIKKSKCRDRTAVSANLVNAAKIKSAVPIVAK